MKTADFDTLYIFYQNEYKFSQEKLVPAMRIKTLTKLFNKPPEYFAETYLPLMYHYMNIFLNDQKRMEDPYHLPSKKLMLEYARYLCTNLP